jgi:hypothetical protein
VKHFVVDELKVGALFLDLPRFRRCPASGSSMTDVTASVSVLAHNQAVVRGCNASDGAGCVTKPKPPSRLTRGDTPCVPDRPIAARRPVAAPQCDFPKTGHSDLLQQTKPAKVGDADQAR